MSLVPTFVQAVDGRFYKDPVVAGDDWWICFDDDDDPEIIVRHFKNSTPESGKTRASKVMREAGIEFKDIRYSRRCQRIFPPKWDKFFEAQCFWFYLMAPIPLPCKYDAVVQEPTASCVMYGFFTDVSSEDCARAVLGMDIDLMIARALLAQPFYKKQQEKVRPEIAKKLYQQVPWLRELTRDNWQEALKDKPTTVRLQWRRS